MYSHTESKETTTAESVLIGFIMKPTSRSTWQIEKMVMTMPKDKIEYCWNCGEPIKGEPWKFPGNDGVYCTLCALALAGPYELPTKPVPKKVKDED